MKYIFVVTALMLGACRHRPPMDEIRRLLLQLEHSPCVITGPVGIVDTDTPEGDAYKALVGMTPDSIWVRVSYSKEPVMRMYAFEALRYEKSPELEAVRSRLKNDSAVVCWRSADVESSISIAERVSMH